MTTSTGKLLKAHEWRTNYAYPVRVIQTERAIRPLYALERRDRGHQTPEVVARAAELAVYGIDEGADYDLMDSFG